MHVLWVKTWAESVVAGSMGWLPIMQHKELGTVQGLAMESQRRINPAYLRD